MQSDLLPVDENQGGLVNSTFYLAKCVNYVHKFTQIELFVPGEHQLYVWLLQLDEGGIKQWLGFKSSIRDGYKRMTRFPETIRICRNQLVFRED